jgi:cytoskeleton protein RodZ
MSETAFPDGMAAPAATTAGTLLREAREAAGLHVASLAATLKVPVQKLEALEQDRYDLLPDAVFVRALASSVCRTLKIDPAPVLQRLPQTPQPRLADSGQAINAPFRSPKDGPPPGVLNQVSRPVLLIVVALLLAALVLIFLPFAQRGFDTVAQANRSEPAPATTDARPEQPTTAPAQAASSVAGLPAAPASAAGPVPTAAAITQAPEAAGPAGNGVQLRTSASTTPAAPAGRPASAAAPAAVAAAPASAAAPAASAPADARGVVVFRARGQSWVQVKDSRGTTVMQKLLEAGETAAANGPLPLTVVVGSAQNTDVQVRGQPFDLARLTRDNVARFEVK